MSPDFVRILVTAAGTTMAVALVVQFFGLSSRELGESRRRRIAQVKEQISKKMDAKIPISAADVSAIGRGLDASQGMAVHALYQLFAETDEQGLHEQIRKLIDDLTREDPFESLPEVVRPSLARLTTLCRESPQSTDKELLHPIVKVLDEYQEMRRDHAVMKRQTRVSYVVALISFFIGVVGIILAFNGPSKVFVRNQLAVTASHIVEQVRAQQSAGSSGALHPAQP